MSEAVNVAPWDSSDYTDEQKAMSALGHFMMEIAQESFEGLPCAWKLYSTWLSIMDGGSPHINKLWEEIYQGHDPEDIKKLQERMEFNLENTIGNLSLMHVMGMASGYALHNARYDLTKWNQSISEAWDLKPTNIGYDEWENHWMNVLRYDMDNLPTDARLELRRDLLRNCMAKRKETHPDGFAAWKKQIFQEAAGWTDEHPVFDLIQQCSQWIDR